ncbi:MAG: DUF3054 domain-containing protein [Ilumatobacteraceae bacterium]
MVLLLKADVTGARTRVAAALDVAVVAVFVAVGRRNHDEGSAVGDLFRIAAPFLIGLATGWFVARAWRRPFDLAAGCTIWIVTVALGMVLRRTVFDRGTALSFVVVATVFTGALMIGWRLVARRVTNVVTPGS